MGTKKTLKNGTIEYFNNDEQLHRDNDLPAVERINGTKYWYTNGKLNRKGNPAIEWINGIREWYTDGQLNRLDGPAVIYSNGHKLWFVDGKEYTKQKFDKFIEELQKLSNK